MSTDSVPIENKPLVSVITVNYNSRKIMDVVKTSIRAILNLKYRPIEFIIVDNGSDDGSYEEIVQLINNAKPVNATIKVFRLSKNYGFAVANNIAFLLRNKNSKYVALINNDLAPTPDSLNKLIEYLESHPEIAGVQGKILSWDGKFIDSAGCFMDDVLGTYTQCQTLKPELCNEERYVGYIDGAYSVYRISALKKCGGLFIPYFFMYGDDYELGIRLWRCGFKLMYVPVIVGRHYRSATVKSINNPLYDYWGLRSEISVRLMYERSNIITWLHRFLQVLILSRYKLHGFIDGLFYGYYLKNKIKFVKLLEKSTIKEPRVYVRNNLILEFRFYIHWENKASKMYYMVISRILNKNNGDIIEIK